MTCDNCTQNHNNIMTEKGNTLDMWDMIKNRPSLWVLYIRMPTVYSKPWNILN